MIPPLRVSATTSAHARPAGLTTRLALGLALGLLPLAAPPSSAQSSRISAPAPIKNFTAPFFNDEGYHTMVVRGGEARILSPQRIALADMNLTLFSGDERRLAETVILAPEALVQPEAQLVSGPAAVRLIRDDVELTGEDWTYDHAAQKISINRRARLVFQAAVADLLK